MLKTDCGSYTTYLLGSHLYTIRAKVLVHAYIPVRAECGDESVPCEKSCVRAYYERQTPRELIACRPNEKINPMTVKLKYHLVESQTIEMLRRQRQLIEDALSVSRLTPVMRAALLEQLNVVLRKENYAVANSMGEDSDDGDDDEENEGEGTADKDESGRGERGGGSGSGSGGPSNMEILALLFYLAEEIAINPSEQNVMELSIDDSLAAATFLFNRAERIADIPHLYFEVAEDPLGNVVSPGNLLPSIEHRATHIGAQTLCLRAHTASVATLQSKHGYEPCGTPYYRRGVKVQKMRKSLTPPPSC